MLRLIAAAAVLTALPLLAAGRLQPQVDAPLQMLKGGGSTIYLLEPIRLVSAEPALSSRRA
jgi:hypothetical protein